MRTVGLFRPIDAGIIQIANPARTVQAARSRAAGRNGIGAVMNSATGKAKFEQQGWRVAREFQTHEAPPGAALSVVERLRQFSRERGLIV